MTRSEKISELLRVLNQHFDAWKNIDEKTLDSLLLITEAYLKIERVKELDAVIAKAQSEKEAITKEQ
jgi:hypothetical protein